MKTEYVFDDECGGRLPICYQKGAHEWVPNNEWYTLKAEGRYKYKFITDEYEPEGRILARWYRAGYKYIQFEYE